MSCGPCQQAGFLNADANRVYTPQAARVLRKAAIEAHGRCRKGACDCDHKLAAWAKRRGY